jgi:membrane-bound lytic murein transglycosylase B
MAHHSYRWAVAGLALGLFVGACETQVAPPGSIASTEPAPAPPVTPQTPPPPPEPVTAPSKYGFAFRSSGDPRFDAWRDEFAEKAKLAGHQDAVVISVLDALTPIAETVQTQTFENQAEFVKPIWDYARSAVSASRISNGQAKLADNKAIFDSVEGGYNPPREIVAAIWGMESAYGAVIGNLDAPTVLASQAAMGRRKDFNEGELMAIMQLIEKGAATRDDFRRASYAGAIGQTQFMPSTFLAHAADFDKDGREDLWFNTGDAVASAANYLGELGWKKGQPWAVETTIPQGFDYSLGDFRKMSVAEWKKLGLAPATVARFAADDSLQAELFLPAGSYGPAFLLFDNFYVIKRYNNADSYALAIGLLADRLAGGSDLSRPWPTDMPLLTPDQAKQLQAGLNQLGYNAGNVDGVIGRGTRGALQKFQKDKGLVADGFPSVDMLPKVTAAAPELTAQAAPPAAAPPAPVTPP